VSGGWRLAQVAAAVVAGIALGLLWLAHDNEDRSTTQRPTETLAVAAEVKPEVHVFGDPVEAAIDVVVDRTLIVPESVSIQADFAPYDQVGPVSVQRSESGSAARVQFRYQLECLREGCAPQGARRVVEFTLGRVLYRFRGRSGQGVDVIDWPPFEVTGRVAQVDVESGKWRASATSLPRVSYRVGPVSTAVALLGGSLTLALAAALLAWRLGARRLHPELADQPLGGSMSPLERALELARQASRNGAPPERRKALERVALELGTLGHPELENSARSLAWAAPGPSLDDVDELARRVEAVVPATTPAGQGLDREEPS
jgi:hypothetical protein